MTTPITRENLIAAGFNPLPISSLLSPVPIKYFRYLSNEKDNGKYGRTLGSWAIEVVFEKLYGYNVEWMVYITASNSRFAVHGALTIEDLDELYRLFKLPIKAKR